MLVFDICQQHHTGVDCEAHHHQINQTSKGLVKTMILGEVKGGEGECRNVDKVQLDKLQAELKALHVQLEAKEEQVAKLSRIRDEVEAELEELTASLFQVCQ